MNLEVNPKSPVKKPVEALKVAAKQNYARVKELLDQNGMKADWISSGPQSLFGFLAGDGERAVQDSTYYVEFRSQSQAKRFLELAKAAGMDAGPSYAIKKRGLDWVKCKTFRKVRVSPTMKQLKEIDQTL